MPIPRSKPPVKAPRRRLQPDKLLLSKWTAVVPQAKEKHFLVTRLVAPDVPGAPLERVQIEAVHSGRSRIIDWRELADPGRWLQGWS